VRRGLLLLLGMLLLLAVALPTAGDTELVLIDGRVLRGVDLSRRDGVYTLRLENGSEVAFPEELVEQVRLIGEEKPSPRYTPDGYRLSEAEELSGNSVPEGPSGLRSEESQTLAGKQVTPPRRDEQLAVFGEPAEFQKDIIDNRWVPESDWDMDPEKGNNFAPSTWSKGVVDPTWKPESAFDADKDVLKNSRSTWSKSIVDSTWEPTDAFAKRRGRP